ncbi:hypothetical protein ACE6H2_028300 [Prunus campanulata]
MQNKSCTEAFPQAVGGQLQRRPEEQTLPPSRRFPARGEGEDESESDEGDALRWITSWDCTGVQACKQECSHKYANARGYG